MRKRLAEYACPILACSSCFNVNYFGSEIIDWNMKTH